MKQQYILLGFDLEEFDMPLEYGVNITFEEQLRYSDEGISAVMQILNTNNSIATFFTTANYALQRKELIKNIATTHEIASHTYYHSNFDESHLLQSRKVLEDIAETKVEGLRMPRMRNVSTDAVIKAGYYYDSSVHPTWLPGRYNNLSKPRTIYKDNGLIILPASVTPIFRIPLFWLAFKNFPFWLYKKWVKQTLQHDGYVCLYYHPWEFTSLKNSGIPAYTRTIDGNKFSDRLDKLIVFLQQYGDCIKTIDFLKLHHRNWD